MVIKGKRNIRIAPRAIYCKYPFAGFELVSLGVDERANHV